MRRAILLGVLIGCNLLAFAQGIAGQDSTVQQSSSLEAKDDTSSFWSRRAARRKKFAERNDSYKIGEVFFANSGIQDTRNSPLIFEGYGVGITLGNLMYGTKSLNSFEMSFRYSQVETEVDVENAMHVFQGDINYSHQRKIKVSKGKLYVGASINNLINGRLYLPLGNNAVSFDYSAALLVEATWIKESFLKNNWLFKVNTGFALLSYNMRFPKFAFTGLEHSVSTMNRYNKMFVNLGISPKLKNSKENRWYVGYSFNFYGLASSLDQKRVGQYIHAIKWAYWLKSK